MVVEGIAIDVLRVAAELKPNDAPWMIPRRYRCD